MYFVKDVMIPKVISIHESATIGEAARSMAHHGIGSLVVVPDGLSHASNLPTADVGLITERDILTKVVAHELSASILVSEVASRSPQFIDADADLQDAFELMSKHRLRQLIVSSGGRVAGIVSLRELSNAIRFCSARHLLGVQEREHFRHD
jgi:CBS domain-containing protein